MGVNIDKKKALVFLLLIIVLAELLRGFNIGHVLSWDEAWNVHTVFNGARGLTSSAFFYNFWRHPPLYMGLGMLYVLLGAGRAGVATALEVTSIIFSLLTVVVIYLCGRDWSGEEAGLIAAFFYAVMPAARVFDSWIKPDSMAVALGLLFFFFFFRKRYVLSGVFLGLSLLAKEVIVFFPLALLLFILVSRRFEKLKGFAISIATGIVVSFWWYLFLSKSTGAFTDFFLGKGTDAAEWHRPLYYYFRRVPEDIGWVLLAAVLVGFGILAYNLATRRGSRKAELDKTDMALFYTCWIVAIYVLLSISHGKPPWMTYTALPAFALLGGWSLMQVAHSLRKRRTLALCVVALVLVLSLLLSLLGGFNQYMLKAGSGFDNAINEKRAAEYINGKTGKDGRLLLDFGDFGLPPHFLFYLDAYDPKKLVTLPQNPGGAPQQGSIVLMLNNNTTPDEVERYILESNPDYVAVLHSDDPPEAPYTRLAEELARWSKPKNFRVLWVFDGKKLADALSR